MNNHAFYYRLTPLGIDCTDEAEIKEYNSALPAFRFLDDRFDELEAAFSDETKERADIVVDAVPDVSGVIELSVYHKLHRRLFNRTVKTNCFSLCITKLDGEIMRLYFYDTADITEVKRIFRDFTENAVIPDLSKWSCEYIG